MDANIKIKYNSATVHIDGLEIRTVGTQMDYSLTACSALTRGFRFVTAKAKYTTAAEALQGATKLAASLGKKLCKNCAAAAQAMVDAEAAAEAAAAEVAEAAAPAPVEAPAATVPATVRRAAQGAASAQGWELLYDKPAQGCEVGRRVAQGKAEYALICKSHRHVHPVARLTAERAVRTAGGWCPACSA